MQPMQPMAHAEGKFYGFLPAMKAIDSMSNGNGGGLASSLVEPPLSLSTRRGTILVLLLYCVGVNSTSIARSVVRGGEGVIRLGEGQSRSVKVSQGQSNRFSDHQVTPIPENLLKMDKKSQTRPTSRLLSRDGSSGR
jgi:hypothetical protein